MKKEKLILALIKDDLINCKLINGLDKLGINAHDYTLNLSDTIFKLMEFENNLESERLFEKYIKLSEQAVKVDITNSKKNMDKLVKKIYKELTDKKIDQSC